MTCDPKDAHVLAAAIASDCQVIVTFNVKDFPRDSVTPHDLEVVDPDTFLLDQFDLHPRAVRQALFAQLDAYTRPTLTPRALSDALERCGLTNVATQFRHQADLNDWT